MRVGKSLPETEKERQKKKLNKWINIHLKEKKMRKNVCSYSIFYKTAELNKSV